ncbi:hypothetical protein ACHQM5_002928 [Ranunculus cassubicifolius]
MKTQASPQISIPTRRSKTREISSRFLSSPTSSIESSISNLSPTNQALSPIHKKPPPSRVGGLWPKSAKKPGTLADHLGNDRLKDLLDDRKKTSSNNGGGVPQFLTKQKSCSEFNRFEKEKNSSKENHKPKLFGGSMRYTGKLHFPGKKSASSTTTSSKSATFSNILPGRLSVDESSINRRRVSDSFPDSDSECSDYGYGISSGSSSYLSSTASSRRLAGGIEVSSRYLHDPSLTRSSSRRASTPDNTLNNLPPKNAMKRTNSLSQWALSPGRVASPPMSVENKGKPVMSFSGLRPPHSPHSPARSKGVGNLFSLGLDLFKSKKSSSSSSCLSPVGNGGGSGGESCHQLKMVHNKLVQWRYVNCRAELANAAKITQAESSLLNTSAVLSNLQSSVVQKRIQFQKEKLEFRLYEVLHSQVEPLKALGDMERQHLSALSTTKDCLHSVVCRVPLVDGAKLEPQPTSIALRHAADLTASIKSTLSEFSPVAQEEGELLTELAEVVTEEKSLLEECFDLIGLLSALETQERSLQCSIVQLKSQQQQQQYQSRRQPHDIVT